MKSNTIENEVYKILQINTQSRKDDMFLYYLYLRTKGIRHDAYYLVFSVPSYRNIHNIASYQTVSRTRRRLQECDPKLKDPTTAAFRAEKEKNYIQYAIGYDNIDL